MDGADVRELLEAYGFADLEDELRPLASLRLVPGGHGAGRSRFGGAPAAAPGFEWPRIQDGPMAFLAELSLAEVRAALPESPLPADGRLLFFYEQEATEFHVPHDDGRGRVLLAADDDGLEPAAAPDGLELRLPERALGLVREWTLPDPFSAQVERLRFDEPRRQAYFDLYDALALRQAAVEAGGLTGEVPQHRLLGYPAFVQDEPDGADEWRLLLQLDSDPELDMMWGDAGRLYFFTRAGVRESRAVLQST